MRRKPYKRYSREFRLEAVRLAEVGDKTASQVARELGIRVNQVLIGVGPAQDIDPEGIRTNLGGGFGA